MDTPVLDLTEHTLSQAVLALDQALGEGLSLHVLVGTDDVVKHNLLKLLARRGRRVTTLQEGLEWVLDIEGETIDTPLFPKPAVPLHPASVGPLPVLLTRRSLSKEGHPLGERMLLNVLQALPQETPWLLLALDAVQLLEDTQGMRVLQELQARGVSVRISRESLLAIGGDPGPFEIMEEAPWQSLLAKGELRLIA